MPEPHFEDPVVAEIHAIRAQMLAECGGDHRKLMEQVDERERTSGRKVIPPPPAIPSTTNQSVVRSTSEVRTMAGQQQDYPFRPDSEALPGNPPP